MPKDSEYGDMTPEQIEEYKKNTKKYEMTDEEIEEERRLIREGKIRITHVNRILDMKGYKKP